MPGNIIKNGPLRLAESGLTGCAVVIDGDNGGRVVLRQTGAAAADAGMNAPHQGILCIELTGDLPQQRFSQPDLSQVLILPRRDVGKLPAKPGGDRHVASTVGRHGGEGLR